jgi:hypothetical protein
VAGTASVNFLDDFEPPTWDGGDTVFFNNGYTDDYTPIIGAIPPLVNENDGISSSQGVVNPHASVFGRTVHAGNLGGSFTAHVSAFIRATKARRASS